MGLGMGIEMGMGMGIEKYPPVLEDESIILGATLRRRLSMTHNVTTSGNINGIM